MRAYELMVIHDGDLDDVQVQDALQSVQLESGLRTVVHPLSSLEETTSP